MLLGLDEQNLMHCPDLDRAMGLLTAGKPIKALECAQRYAAMYPDHALGHIIESAIAEQAHCHAAAVSACRRATELCPSRIDLFLRGIRSSLHIHDETTANRFFSQVTPLALETGQHLEELWILFLRACRAFQPSVSLKSRLPPLPAAPMVSVVIAPANDEARVHDTLESVVAQRYRYWEAIVVNVKGDPLPVTREDARIRVVDLPSGTLPDARNRGLELIGGHLFCFLDEGVVLDRMYFAVAVSSLRSRKIIGAFADTAERSGRVTAPPAPMENFGVEKGRRYAPLLLQMHRYVDLNEVIFRTDALGSLRFDTTMEHCSDWDYLQNAFAAGPLDRIEQTLVLRGSHPTHEQPPFPESGAACRQFFDKHPPARPWISYGRQLLMGSQFRAQPPVPSKSS